MFLSLKGLYFAVLASTPLRCTNFPCERVSPLPSLLHPALLRLTKPAPLSVLDQSVRHVPAVRSSRFPSPLRKKDLFPLLLIPDL